MANIEMHRVFNDTYPSIRGKSVFFRKKWQAFKEAVGIKDKPKVYDPLPVMPEFDLTGPTKVPFDSMYDIQRVHVAHRRSDGQEVFFNVLSSSDDYNVRCPGSYGLLDEEVVINVMVSGRERSQHVQPLHRWFEEKRKIILVYENPSTSLKKHIKNSGGFLHEAEARVLFKQAAEGVKHTLDHGVFHQQIRPKKFYIDKRTNLLKLNLFSHKKFLPSLQEIREFKGRDIELGHMEAERFYAEISTVWSLGKLAYEMMHGHEPYKTKKWIKTKTKTLDLDSSLSRECRDFLTKCLEKNPMRRMNLQEMMAHEWMNEVQEEAPIDSMNHEVHEDLMDQVKEKQLNHEVQEDLMDQVKEKQLNHEVHKDLMDQVKEKQLFEGAFMTRKAAGRKVIIKVLIPDGKGATHSLSWVQDDCKDIQQMDLICQKEAS